MHGAASLAHGADARVLGVMGRRSGETFATAAIAIDRCVFKQ
ncbi:hypothetical protein [Luteitalea pratensis]|nr:hypothetical protein [Luteitalea pratensis]